MGDKKPGLIRTHDHTLPFASRPWKNTNMSSSDRLHLKPTAGIKHILRQMEVLVKTNRHRIVTPYLLPVSSKGLMPSPFESSLRKPGGGGGDGKHPAPVGMNEAVDILG